MRNEQQRNVVDWFGLVVIVFPLSSAGLERIHASLKTPGGTGTSVLWVQVPGTQIVVLTFGYRYQCFLGTSARLVCRNILDQSVETPIPAIALSTFLDNVTTLKYTFQ